MNAKPSGSTSGGSVAADADSTEDGDTPAEPEDENPIVCRWGEEQIYYRAGQTEVGEYVYSFIDLRYWRIRPSTGEVWLQTRRICTQGDEVVSNGLEWRVVVNPDPSVLAQSLYDRVVRQVPLPSSAMSPGGPGFVNLGMWLAIAEPSPISVTAQAGPVWATTTARLESTTFDLGNGDVVTCDGFGDPIPPELTDSIEPSPICGYTYADVSPDGSYTVTITATWRVSWTGSGGVGGDLGTLGRTITVDYEVREIQTVGTR